jgi:hypothetical protein
MHLRAKTSLPEKRIKQTLYQANSERQQARLRETTWGNKGTQRTPKYGMTN